MTSPQPADPDDDPGALRSYGGEAGADRVARRRAALIDAALELLGGEGAAGAVTVRGVCRQAGLTARYFYESFPSAEDLVAKTFDTVIAEIATGGLAAFETGVDVEDKVGLAVGAIVDVIDADRRKGRLLFSQSLQSPTVAVKRMESTALFAMLTLQTASGIFDVEPGPEALAAVHFQVGGLARLLAAWLEGEFEMERDAVVATSVRLLLAVGDLVARHEPGFNPTPGPNDV